jgi:hypothetical protein
MKYEDIDWSYYVYTIMFLGMIWCVWHAIFYPYPEM